MIPKEFSDQIQAEVASLKKGQDQFLETYKKLCAHCGEGEWPRKEFEMIFHRVRREVIPIMEQAGMDHASVQGLCSWAERQVLRQAEEASDWRLEIGD